MFWKSKDEKFKEALGIEDRFSSMTLDIHRSRKVLTDKIDQIQDLMASKNPVPSDKERELYAEIKKLAPRIDRILGHLIKIADECRLDRATLLASIEQVDEFINENKLKYHYKE